jgi:predicted phage tail protein
MERFKMSDWLPSALCDAGQDGAGTITALNTLADLLAKKIESYRYRKTDDKRLTIVFAGLQNRQ